MTKTNGFQSLLQDRELGVKSIDLSEASSHILEDLHCWRLDQHHIEGQEGDLIPPLACSFNKENPDLLAVADEAGGLLILNTSKHGPLAVTSDFLAHDNMIWDLAWLPGGGHLVTASGDQTVALWDVEAETKIGLYKGHTSSVRTVSVCAWEPSIFSTGSIDGNILIWDRRKKCKGDTGSYVGAVKNAHTCPSVGNTKKSRKPGPSLDNRESVTSVIFQDENTLLSSGSKDGCIKVWDTRKLSKVNPTPTHTFTYAGSSGRARGYSSMVLDSSRTRLFASCMDNKVYMFDCAAFSKNPVSIYQGHRVSSFFVKLSLSPDDQFLLSGSSDSNAYIWQVSCPRSSPVQLKGHTAEVPAVAWSPTDMGRIVTTSDDCSLMVWRLQRGIADKTVDSSLGTLVGTALRSSREVGTSVSQSPFKSGLRIRPVTPRKGHTVPPSPVKISTAVKQTLAAMQGLPSMMGAKACVRQAQTTIVKWLGKSPASVNKARLKPQGLSTPRKLIITPKKTNTPVQRDPILAAAEAEKMANVRGVKRKLDCGLSAEKNSEPPSSKQKIDESLQQNENSMSPKSLQHSPMRSTSMPLRAINQQTVPPASPCEAKKVLFDTVDKTPERKSLLSENCHYQSPTANLPNYVMNPQPRAPQAPSDLSLAPKTPNWLTQLRRQRTMEGKGAGSPGAECRPDSPVLEEGAASRGVDKTPRSSCKLGQPPTTPKTPIVRTPVMKRRGSILQYFSPKN